MVVWIDAQLAPTIAAWLRDTFRVAAVAAWDLQLRDAEDAVIFRATRSAGAVARTKDADFEPPRFCRRLPPVRGWSHEHIETAAAVQS